MRLYIENSHFSLFARHLSLPFSLISVSSRYADPDGGRSGIERIFFDT